MVDFVRPFIRKKTQRIIHTGTNELQSGTNTLLNIDTIVKEVDHAGVKVVISGLSHREDNPDLTNRLEAINNELKSFCAERNIPFIDNSNIDPSGLNYGKLHLNMKGAAQLAKNFKEFLMKS